MNRTLSLPLLPSALAAPKAVPSPLSPPSAETLATAAAAATALSQWLLAPPDATVLDRLGDAAVLEEWPRRYDAATCRGLRRVRRAHDPEAVRADHARLFVGPEPVGAPPCESRHTSDEDRTGEVETLDVRASYAHFGLSAPRLGGEPDDHVGLELEFVAVLTGWAVDALDAADERSAGVYVAAVWEFLETHLLRWAPGFADLVSAHAETDFYRGVADLLQGLLGALADLVGREATA